MIRPALLLAIVVSLVLLWHECGQDLGVFCYRISLGAFTGLRERGLVPIPSRESFHLAARNRSECLTPSVTSSTCFSIPRDSNS
jgi:hypothetical protein